MQRDHISAVFAAAGLTDEFHLDDAGVQPPTLEDDADSSAPASRRASLLRVSALSSLPTSDAPLSADAALLHQQEHYAVSAFNDGRYADALSHLSLALPLALSLSPLSYASLLTHLSMTHSALDCPSKALTSADQALLLSPRHPLAHLQRGLALQALGRLPAALSALTAAASLLPSPLADDDDAATIRQALSDLTLLLSHMRATALTLSPLSPSSLPSPLPPLLLAWLEAGGASLPYLHIRTSPSHSHSIHTLTSLPTHTPVLSIPSSRLIRLSHSLVSPVGRVLLARGFPLTLPHAFLACHLHYHLQCVSSSPLLPYLRMLPPLSAFSALPLFYPPAILHLFPQPLPAHAQVMMADLRAEYDLLLSTLSPPSLLTSLTSFLLPSSSTLSSSPTPTSSTPPPPLPPTFLHTLTFPQYLRLRLFILSRAFGLPQVDGGEAELALVPGADLLNHCERGGEECGEKGVGKGGAEVKWTWEDGERGAEGRLVMTTLREVQAGQELRHCYGAKSNRRWLLHYGMVLHHNVHHTVELPLTITAATLSPAKRAMLAALPLSPAVQGVVTVELSASACSPSSALALAVLRVVHGTGVEVEGRGRFGRGEWGGGLRGASWSEGNEGSVVGWLAATARVELGRLGGEEQGEVEEQKVGRGRKRTKGKRGESEEVRVRRERKWMALVYRVTERRVWRWWAELDERVKQKLTRWQQQEGGEDDGQVDGVEKRVEPDNEVDAYWARVWLPMLQAQRDALRGEVKT